MSVSAAAVAANPEGIDGLPAAVQEALGALAGAGKEGLLVVSVGVGLGVLHELLEAEVDEVVGPKGRHDPDRTAVRHGHDRGEVNSAGGVCRSSARASAAPTASTRSDWA